MTSLFHCHWNEWPFVHSIAAISCWKLSEDSYNAWSNPVIWSWMWNENNPDILHDWQDFSEYLREGQWR